MRKSDSRINLKTTDSMPPLAFAPPLSMKTQSARQQSDHHHYDPHDSLGKFVFSWRSSLYKSDREALFELGALQVQVSNSVSSKFDGDFGT